MTAASSRRGSRRVFLDSSAFLALVNPHDIYHQHARATWTRLAQERWSTFTSNFVLAEAHALFLVRLGQPSALAFLKETERSSIVLARVMVSDEDSARAVIYRYTDKDFSYTDATSFAVMDRLAIPTAFTFDRHFAQYGLTVVPAPSSRSPSEG